MNSQGPSVSDTNKVAAAIVASLRLTGATLPPLSVRIIELALAWLINDAQKEAFQFAVSALQAATAARVGQDRVVTAFSEIARQSGDVAEKAKSQLGSLGKPS